MIRIHVVCEGQTEEMFINEVLADLFKPKDIFLYPTLIGKPGHKGGYYKFNRLLIDLKARLLGDTESYCTTLFDFYGLPDDFPGKTEAQKKTNSNEKAKHLLNALTMALNKEIGAGPLRRFIPYVQMYEFEGLLFSDTDIFAKSINQSKLATDFKTIRDSFASPEEINDSAKTAPSKRIEALFNGYDKTVHGSLAAMEIGLAKIRNECPLFNSWLINMESLKPI